jgi:HK97 family phage major capsid protein
MLRATEGHARALVDAQSRFMFPEDDDAEARGFIGRPIDNSPGMPPDGVVANKCVLFGDMNGFVIAHRGLVSLDVFRETYADLDQTAVRLLDRVGGAVANIDAFRAGR